MDRIYNIILVDKTTKDIVMDKKVVANAQMAALKKAGGDCINMKRVELFIQHIGTI